MKKLIIALCLLVACPSFAQSFVPTYGCFTHQGNFCGGGCSTVSTIPCFSDHTQNVLGFGTTVAGLCLDYNNCLVAYGAELNKTQTCSTNLSQMQTNSDVHYGWYSECFNSAKAAAKKSDSLIKKLRKACGSKCKKIK